MSELDLSKAYSEVDECLKAYGIGHVDAMVLRTALVDAALPHILEALGLREEWGIEWDNLNGSSYIDAYSSRFSAETAYQQSYSGALRTVRRRVTEWGDA